jgi:acetyltransferase-like isoleucine patch superfamily enzyme
MLRILAGILQFPYRNGIFLPFKTYVRSSVLIRNDAEVSLAGRLTIGNPDKHAARISLSPALIYIGYKAKAIFGRSISIGAGVKLIVKDGGELSIGDNTYFTSDMHLEAIKKIAIGAGCAISWGVTIIDDDHHQVLSKEPGSDASAGVKIGDHVWIGCNAVILKGTEIGNNCIVAAGSIVKGKFPDNVMIAGSPAKIVKQEINWK